jgi:thioredoxin 1
MAAPLTDAEFSAKVLKSSKPVFVDFWAPWCGPCKAMIPIVDELSKTYDGKIEFYKMNVDENMETPQSFSVMSIPTFIIFKNGDAVDTFIGVKSKEDVAARLEAVLK